MTLPLEQSTILIIDGMVRVAGVFPIAVTTTSKVRVASAFETNLTFYEMSKLWNMVASLPTIEYEESPQSGLLYVYGVST